MKTATACRALLLAGLLAGGAARADPTPLPPSGLELGLRGGLAVPTGTALEGTGVDLSLVVARTIPVTIDVAWRFTEHLSVGATLRRGFGTLAACDPGTTCEASDDQLSGAIAWRFDDNGAARPWVSVGAGYEWLRVSERRGASNLEVTVSGATFLNLEGGLDFQPTPRLLAGPYLSFVLGRFRGGTVTEGGAIERFTYPADRRSTHHWSQVGLRVAYLF